MAKREKKSGRRAPEKREELEEDDVDAPRAKHGPIAPNTDSVMYRYGGLIVPAVLLGLVAFAILFSLLVE